jgi:hypothetical protein
VAKGDDLAAIRQATEALQTASHGMAEQLYKQSQNDKAQATGHGPHDADIKEGEVVDA